MGKSVCQAFSEYETNEANKEREYEESMIINEHEFQMKLLQMKLDHLDALSQSISKLADAVSGKKPPITINIFTNENTTPEQLEEIVAKFK